MSGSACGAVVIGALLWSPAARAGLVTINFPQDVVPSTVFSGNNATAGGFRISPSSEYALIAAGGPSIIPHGIGWDSGGPANPSYLGPVKVSTASLYVDHGGTPFSLQSIEFVSSGLDSAFQVLSSKGGIYLVPHMFGAADVSFAGSPSLWTDIDWLIFGYFDAGVPSAGIDQLVVSVDEPETLTLFALGLAALAMVLRRPTPKHRYS
jgi:hypothetical protein